MAAEKLTNMRTWASQSVTSQATAVAVLRRTRASVRSKRFHSEAKGGEGATSLFERAPSLGRDLVRNLLRQVSPHVAQDEFGPAQSQPEVGGSARGRRERRNQVSAR